MKTFKIEIYKDWLPLLEKSQESSERDNDGKKLEFKIAGEEEEPGRFRKLKVEVTAETDQELFMLGFWLERNREQEQCAHYDLKDQSELKVEVPEAFNLVCQAHDLQPAQVLSSFATDLCLHPFHTNGSDERAMAMGYFQRAYLPGAMEPEKSEDLFDSLNWIRGEWYQYGNPRMEEFKAFYKKELKKLATRFLKKKKSKN